MRDPGYVTFVYLNIGSFLITAFLFFDHLISKPTLS